MYFIYLKVLSILLTGWMNSKISTHYLQSLPLIYFVELNIKKSQYMETKVKKISTLQNTFTIGGWTLFSRILGLARDITTTSLQGASLYHDIYLLILRIPTSLRTFLIDGAFSNAFIPVYSNLLGKNKKKESILLLNSLFGIFLVALFILIIIALVFPKPFIFIFAPGYYSDLYKIQIAIQMHQIMFPYLGLVSFVSFAGGIQNSHNKFGVPAATPILFNICIISSAFFIAPYLDIPMYGLAIGVLVSGILQVFFQIPELKKLRISLRPLISLKNNYGLKEFFSLFLPAFIVGSFLQINLLIDSVFSSFLPEGSPTWLYISQRLMQLPLGIFAIAIGTVLLPSLSRSHAANQITEYKNSVNQGLRLVVFLGVPSTVGMIIFSEQIVGTIFNRGGFSWADIEMTAYSLSALTIGLPFFMIHKILAPAFFSRLDAKTPMKIGIATISINIALNYILGFYLGWAHVGVALSSAIATMISVSILMWILYKNKFIEANGFYNGIYIKIIFSSALLGLYLFLVAQYLNFENLSEIQRIIYLFLSIFGGILIYLISCFILGLRFKHFRSNYTS